MSFDVAGESAIENQPPGDRDEAPSSSPGRRGRPRSLLEVEITLGSESHFFAGITNDISTGGVFVVTYESPPIGTDLEMRFYLPSATVRARGSVRWSRRESEHAPPGVGVAFTSLSREDREEIERFCHERAPLYYELGE